MKNFHEPWGVWSFQRLSFLDLHCKYSQNWFAGEENRAIGRSLFSLQKKGLVLVTQLCLTLCNPMDGSKPGFPVFHYLLEFSQIHVNWVHDTIQQSHPLSSPFPSCFQSFPASGSFPVSQLFTSGGQRTEASASASVLLMNIKGRFPWGLTGWTSLLSKELSRVFSSITVWKHQFFSTQHLYGPTLTSIHGYWKNHSFDYRSLPVARWYHAPVCEKPKFPASVIRMSQHSDSAVFQPPWQLEAQWTPCPDLIGYLAGMIWLQIIVDGMLGIKTFLVHGSLTAIFQPLLKRVQCLRESIMRKKPEFWNFSAVSKF